MSVSKIFFNLTFCTLFLMINLNLCNSATLPANGNTTVDTTAIAKTSNAIIDVFEDVRWFFGRLGIFCDLVEKMLPPEKRDGGQTQLSLNLQSGFRHFLVGVREISKSIVAVLSNKEVQEYQQLSRATDYAQEMVKSVGQFFRRIRILVGNLFEAYNYYVPEVILTKCVGKYLHGTYSHRPMYEYPVLLINDIIEAFQTPVNLRIDDNANGSDQKEEIKYEKNVEQNEILDDEMYVFHNAAISPTPELAARFGNKTEENRSPSEDGQQIALRDKQDGSLSEVPNWKKCFKIYATETIFRKLEFYFLESRD